MYARGMLFSIFRHILNYYFGSKETNLFLSKTNKQVNNHPARQVITLESEN